MSSRWRRLRQHFRASLKRAFTHAFEPVALTCARRCSGRLVLVRAWAFLGEIDAGWRREHGRWICPKHVRR